jgi:hypothetical protein
MSGRVFKRGDIYWIAFYSKSKEYRRSAKTDSKRDAEKVLSHYLGQVARNEFRGFKRENISLSLTEVLADFEDDSQARGFRGFDRIHLHFNKVRTYFGAIDASKVDELRYYCSPPRTPKQSNTLGVSSDIAGKSTACRML